MSHYTYIDSEYAKWQTVHVEYYPSSYRTEGWVVWMPNKCDNWDITEEDVRVDHSEAVAALRWFITEAEEALAFLESQEAKPEEQIEWESGHDSHS